MRIRWRYSGIAVRYCRSGIPGAIFRAVLRAVSGCAIGGRYSVSETGAAMWGRYSRIFGDDMSGIIFRAVLRAVSGGAIGGRYSVSETGAVMLGRYSRIFGDDMSGIIQGGVAGGIRMRFLGTIFRERNRRGDVGAVFPIFRERYFGSNIQGSVAGRHLEALFGDDIP